MGTVETGIRDGIQVITGILNTGEASARPGHPRRFGSEDWDRRTLTVIDCPPGSSLLGDGERQRRRITACWWRSPLPLACTICGWSIELVDACWANPAAWSSTRPRSHYAPLEQFLPETGGCPSWTSIPFYPELAAAWRAGGSLPAAGVRSSRPCFKVFCTRLIEIGGGSMKKLLILSGKGGTGKTTTAAAFIQFAPAPGPLPTAMWTPPICTWCCRWSDRAGGHGLSGRRKRRRSTRNCVPAAARAPRPAASAPSGRIGGHCQVVDPYACEGCGVCAHVCPQKAVDLACRMWRVKQLLYPGRAGVFHRASCGWAGATPASW